MYRINLLKLQGDPQLRFLAKGKDLEFCRRDAIFRVSGYLPLRVQGVKAALAIVSLRQHPIERTIKLSDHTWFLSLFWFKTASEHDRRTVEWTVRGVIIKTPTSIHLQLIAGAKKMCQELIGWNNVRIVCRFRQLRTLFVTDIISVGGLRRHAFAFVHPCSARIVHQEIGSWGLPACQAHDGRPFTVFIDVL